MGFLSRCSEGKATLRSSEIHLEESTENGPKSVEIVVECIEIFEVIGLFYLASYTRLVHGFMSRNLF